MDLNDIRSTPPETVNSQGATVSQPPHRSYRSVVVAVVVLIALIAVGFLLMRSGSQPAAHDDAGNPVYRAEEGGLIEGFPKELLLGGTDEFSESYRIEYGADQTRQMTASFVSKLSYIDTIAAYRDFFEKNNWTVTRYGNYYELPTTFFYATKDTVQVNVTLTSKDNSAGVIVTQVAAN